MNDLFNYLQTQIPREFSVTHFAENGAPLSGYTMSTFYPSIYDLNMFESFSNIIYHVHALWELVLIGEPLVVLAPSPELCSRLVQALVR